MTFATTCLQNGIIGHLDPVSEHRVIKDKLVMMKQMLGIREFGHYLAHDFIETLYKIHHLLCNLCNLYPKLNDLSTLSCLQSPEQIYSPASEI